MTERVLRGADPRWLDLPPLPYEEAKDTERTYVARRRRRAAGQPNATVVDLGDRRRSTS